MNSRVTKWLILLVILAALATIATPIYIYVQDFHPLSRSTNPADWGTFGDYIGGILNPLLSFFTLIVTIIIAFEIRKIEKQNNEQTIQASYQPQIVLDQGLAYIFSGKEEKSRPVEFTREKKPSDYFSALNRASQFDLSAYNIGLGAAKDVKVKFKTDVKAIVGMLNRLQEPLAANKKFVIDFVEFSDVSTLTFLFPNETSKDVTAVHGPGHYLTITHILSTNIKSEPYQINFPDFYLQLYSLYVYVQVSLGKKMYETDWPKFPVLELTMGYSDIGGWKYQKNFEIEFVLFYIMRNQSTFDIKVQEIATSRLL